MIDRNIGVIYKKFQFKLKLNQEIIDKAQRLYAILMENGSLKYESPYLTVPVSILIVSRMEKSHKSLKEISEVSHIKEVDLLKCYERVFEQIKSSLKRL